MDLVCRSKGPENEQDSAVTASVGTREKCVQEEGSVSVAHAAMDYSRAESGKVLD